jgi:hypothetical protein
MVTNLRKIVTVTQRIGHLFLQKGDQKILISKVIEIAQFPLNINL